MRNCLYHGEVRVRFWVQTSWLTLAPFYIVIWSTVLFCPSGYARQHRLCLDTLTALHVDKVEFLRSQGIPMHQAHPLYGHHATKTGRLVIEPNAVPGYSAIFNGDGIELPSGKWVGIFRMARDGYHRQDSDGERGYRLTPYFSDLGEFTSSDKGKTWNFRGFVAVADHRLGSHIKHLEHQSESLGQIYHNLLSRQGDSGIHKDAPALARREWELAKLVLEKFKAGRKVSKPSRILEDPRFNRVVDSTGKKNWLVTVTDVSADLLDGHALNVPAQKFQMGVMKIEVDEDGIRVLNYHLFGPPNNKDTWIINIVPNKTQKEQMSRAGNLLNEPMDLNSKHPIAVGLRMNGKVQLVPLDRLERIFELSAEDWVKIAGCKQCYTTILEPNDTRYGSLGNNDQPKAISPEAVASTGNETTRQKLNGAMWHFYHQTGATFPFPYSTWVEILDRSGVPLYRLPYAIEVPHAHYYRFGDIGYVVFNSGNLISGGNIYHINGAADSGVAISMSKEAKLLIELLKNL